MKIKTLCKFLTSVILLLPNFVFSQTNDISKANEIHMIYMGGSDCAPCVMWRQFELPKLEVTSAFKRNKFTYVIKTIKSPIPPSFFLPNDVKPYKDKLDFASNMVSGSPQTAIIVNGEIYDYYFGTRNAEDVEKMFLSIETKTPYPFERCVKLTPQRKCEIKG